MASARGGVFGGVDGGVEGRGGERMLHTADM